MFEGNLDARFTSKRFGMRPRVLAFAAAIFLAPLPVKAEPFSEVQLEPISHSEAVLVIVGENGAEMAYSPAELEQRMQTYSLTTTTPWREEPAEFAGVLLTELLNANGLGAVGAIVVTAENDYSTVIDRALLDSVPILVATRVDGKAHSRRARGPIQFVLDMDTYTSSELTEESNYVWMAARIEAQN